MSKLFVFIGVLTLFIFAVQIALKNGSGCLSWRREPLPVSVKDQTKQANDHKPEITQPNQP